MPHSSLRRQLAAFVAAYVIVSQDSPTASVTLKRAGEADEHAIRQASLSARGQRPAEELQAHPREQRHPRPPARPRSPTQTPCRRTPIQSSAASRRNGRKKVFSTPYLFAQCGAYSRGRPNGQEEDDRTAQLLANRRRSRRLAPINHSTGVTRKKKRSRNGMTAPEAPQTNRNSQP